MKTRPYSIHRPLLVALFLLTAFGPPARSIPALEAAHPIDSRCSVFTVAKGDRVFFGGNDDYVNPDSWYWVDPGHGDRHGVIWIGEPDNVQQGVNERGLAYDANGLPRVDVNPHAERAPVSGGYTSYPIHILRECATVAEVIAWIEGHEWHSFMHDQMQFADASGDAVIVSAGADGEVVFTRKEPGDGFLVSTNFNVVRPSNGFGHPCWRYDLATELLGGLVGDRRELAADDAAGVLNAVHVEGASSWTISSLVADLTKLEIRLYLFHQFDRPLVLSVLEELANPREAGPLSALFPKDVREEATRRHARIVSRGERCRSVGALWLLLVLASVGALGLPRQRGGIRFWAPATVLLGPVALLIRLLTGRDGRAARGRAALLEALGDVLPVAVAFVGFLALVLLGQAIQGGQVLQFLLVLALPILVGLVFHGALLPGASGFPVARVPQVLVTANLGLAGLSVVTIPLTNLSLRSCALFPPSPWTFVTWWVIAALGALPGVLLVALYERWALGRGFAAWSRLAADEAGAGTPGWRAIWWWIPVSYLVLGAGIFVGALVWRAMAG